MIDMKLAGYHIVSNRYEVAVLKMTLDDDGKQKFNVTDKGDKVPVETPIGHYGNLKQALSGIKRNMIQAGNVKITTIDEYRSESNRIDKMFDDFMDQQLPKSKYEI